MWVTTGLRDITMCISWTTSGARLGFSRLGEGLAGVARFHEMVAEHASDPAEVVVGIETDRGLWVGALIGAGYQVYAINPMAVSRYRDRHRVGGAKSDRGDAKVLADLVRTDRHNHRPVAGDSPESDGIKILARTHQNLIWARTRHTNQVRNALREYYPAALETFDDLAHRDTLAVLGRAPTPTQGARLTLAPDPSSATERRTETQPRQVARRIQKGLRGVTSPHPGRSPTPSGQQLHHWSRSLGKPTARSPPRRKPSRPVLSSTRTPSSTTPSQDSVPCSAPGRSVSSGTTPNATPAPSLAATTPARRPSPSHQAANAPSWPATSATGDSTTPWTNGRSVP